MTMTMSVATGAPRLSLVDPDDATPEVAEAFKLGPVINVFRAMANAETLYPTYIAYVDLLFKPLELNPGSTAEPPTEEAAKTRKVPSDLGE
jgi:hypothetical protein